MDFLFYIGLGRLSNLVVENNALKWTVPEKLEGCIINYLYKVQRSNKTSLLNSNASIVPLEKLGVTSSCNNLVIEIIPVVKVQNQKVDDSSMKVKICEDFQSPHSKLWRWIFYFCLVNS